MVVGEHQPPTRCAEAAARRARTSKDVVTLRFRPGPRPRARCRPSARRARRRRWRPPGSRRPPRARARAPRAGTPAVSGPPRESSGRASARTTPRSSTSLIVSLTGAAAIAASQSSLVESREHALEKLGARERARRVVHEQRGQRRRPRAAPRARTRTGPRRPARRPCPPAPPHPSGSATTIRSTDPTARSASTLHSTIGRPASVTNALGRSSPRRSPRPAATISAAAVRCYFPATASLPLAESASRSSR